MAHLKSNMHNNRIGNERLNAIIIIIIYVHRLTGS